MYGVSTRSMPCYSCSDFGSVLYPLFDISPQFAKGKQNFILTYCSLCVLLPYFVTI